MSAIKSRSVSTLCALPHLSRLLKIDYCNCSVTEYVRTYKALKSVACGEADGRNDVAFVLDALSTMREALDMSESVSPDEYDRAVRVLVFLQLFFQLAEKVGGGHESF